MIRFLLTFAFLAAAGPALAQSAPLETVVEQMRLVSSNMMERIGSIALSLLFTLAVIEMAWTFGKAVIKGEGFSDLVLKLVLRIVIVGFFVFVIELGDDLVRVAVETGEMVGGLSPSAVQPNPDAMLASALGLIGDLLDSMSIRSLGRSLGIVFVCVGVAISTAVSIAILIVAYAELYLMAVATMIALGFGAFEQSRDIAVGYLKMIVGKTLKLITILVVAGIVLTIVEDAVDTEGDLLATMQILMIQIIGLVLMMQLPGAAESVAGGAGNSAAASVAGGAVAVPLVKLATNVTKSAGKAGARGAVAGAVGSFRAGNTLASGVTESVVATGGPELARNIQRLVMKSRGNS